MKESEEDRERCTDRFFRLLMAREGRLRLIAQARLQSMFPASLHSELPSLVDRLALWLQRGAEWLHRSCRGAAAIAQSGVLAKSND